MVNQGEKERAIFKEMRGSAVQEKQDSFISFHPIAFAFCSGEGIKIKTRLQNIKKYTIDVITVLVEKVVTKCKIGE